MRLLRKNISITVLTDNSPAYGLESEHGFALWIQTRERSILLDTGCGRAMLNNAEALGVDLRDIDTVVLSHGHYDHTGNLAHIMECNPGAQLVLHPDAVRERYSIQADDSARSIRMPEEACCAVIGGLRERCHWVTGACSLCSEIGVTGPVPRKTPFEDTGGRFYLDAERCECDLVRDDLALWVRSEEGLVVCLGCCHAGLVNTLEYIREVSGESRIAVIVGGMHLRDADEERLAKTVAALSEYKIPAIYACHCTGAGAIEYMQRHLGSSVSKGYAGLKLAFN